MKYNKIISFAAAAVLLCGCADNDMFSQAPNEPGITGQYDYLNGYNKLKTYVDRNANPNFKLGTGVSAADYLGHKMAWTVTNENFDEFTPGNEMKFASVVKDDGTMDFSTVKDLVNKSAEAGLTVYGHTLCWHSQQNMTYLKTLLAPPNYFLHVTSTSSGSNAWDASITYPLSSPLTVDKTYVITFKGRINAEAWTSKDPVQLYFWPSCEKGTQYLAGFQLTKTWNQVSLEFKASQPIEKLNFEFGFLKGDFCIDDISLVEKGTDKNLILNSDFEDDNVSNWTFLHGLNNCQSFVIRKNLLTLEVKRLQRIHLTRCLISG